MLEQPLVSKSGYNIMIIVDEILYQPSTRRVLKLSCIAHTQKYIRIYESTRHSGRAKTTRAAISD